MVRANFSVSAQEVETPPVTGFSYEFTVFGGSQRATVRQSLVRFFQQTLDDRGMIYPSEWAFHVFGSREFLSFADAAYQGKGGHLTTAAFSSKSTLRDQEEAVNAAIRCNPDLIMIELVGGAPEIISPALVRAAYRSGEYLAVGVVAANTAELFAKTVEGLGICRDDLAWLSGQNSRPRCQIFFEGRCVSDDFVAWLKNKVSYQPDRDASAAKARTWTD